MSTMLTEDARHVAENPDGCDDKELRQFIEYIGDGSWAAPQAAALWPDLPVCDRVFAALVIRNYCNVKRSAIVLRMRGEIARALDEEITCEEIYGRLPEWAKW